jgi:osmoprotectant transport system permease protein
MIFLRAKPDSVAITGAVIGLWSLLPGWLTLKPSRIATGTSLSLWDSFTLPGAFSIIFLWLVCFSFSFRLKNERLALLTGICANLIAIASFLMAGLSAERLLAGEEATARVSLGAGIWLTLIATYIVIFAARQKLRQSPLWKNLVSWSGLAVIIFLFASGWLNELSIVREFLDREARFMQELVHHVMLVGVSVSIGGVLGIMLGIWATRSGAAEKPVFFFSNITQTIPSLALFGLLIAPLSILSFTFPTLRELGIRGVGDTPAIIALIIYSLLPVVRNTYVGLKQVPPAVIDAGRGMGMSRGQIFRRVEMPLAAPIVLEGVRTATVQSVGLAAVAALIGAGGLGWFIFQGLGQAASDLILLGALPIIILAIIADIIMRTIVRLATPKG